MQAAQVERTGPLVLTIRSSESQLCWLQSRHPLQLVLTFQGCCQRQKRIKPAVQRHVDRQIVRVIDAMEVD